MPEPMATTDKALLLHVPPVAVFVNEAVSPEQTAVVPVMAGGNAFTVTTVVVEHPVASV